jgi:hypothetical protein
VDWLVRGWRRLPLGSVALIEFAHLGPQAKAGSAGLPRSAHSLSAFGVEYVQGRFDSFRHSPACGHRFDAACGNPADLPAIELVEALRPPVATRGALTNRPDRDASIDPREMFDQFIEATDVHLPGTLRGDVPKPIGFAVSVLCRRLQPHRPLILLS